MKTSIEETVKKIIIEQLGTPPEHITNDARFIEDLYCDSLDAVELAIAAEEECEINLEDEEIEKCKTVGDAIVLIKTKL